MKSESLTHYFTEQKNSRAEEKQSPAQGHTAELGPVSPTQILFQLHNLAKSKPFTEGEGERRWHQVRSDGEETSKVFSYSYYLLNQE